MSEREIFAGGIGNAGAIYREGNSVFRPATEHSESVHRVLRYVRTQGFLAAPVPLNIADGKEELTYIAGESLIAPYPSWVFSESTIASAAKLLRQFHDAARNYRPDESDNWNRELADTQGAAICHGDPCIDNFVFVDGIAIGIIDFEYMAPGRAQADFGSFLRQSIPIVPSKVQTNVPKDVDPIALIVAAVNGYGQLDPTEVLDGFDVACEISNRFWRNKLASKDPVFTSLWNDLAIGERLESIQQWMNTNREYVLAALECS